MEDMQQVRFHLEKLVIELVIKNAKDEEIEALRKYNLQKIDTMDPSMTNNAKFHMGLAHISGNSALADVLEPLVNNVSRYYIDLEYDFSPHDRILDALMKRDLPLALECLEKDFER
jgi:DNA-binding GntR family transcriptional regulator